MTFKEEKNLQSVVTRWLLGGGGILRLGGGSFMYEVKLVRMWRRGVRGLRFSELPDHELKTLLLASGLRGMEAWAMYGGVEHTSSLRDDVRAPRADAWALHHKISDSALGYKPSDGVVVSEAEGWLIVGYDYGKGGGGATRAPKGRGCEVWAIRGSDYVSKVWAVRGGRGSLTVEEMETWGVRCW